MGVKFKSFVFAYIFNVWVDGGWVGEWTCGEFYARLRGSSSVVALGYCFKS